jgi:predicted DNA-binding antitoxin AbrB/MazE fold protein
MYRAVEAIYQKGQIVPLENLEVEEKSKLLIVVLENGKENYPKWKSLRGKYKNQLISVDDFMAQKQTEKKLEL